MLARGEASLGCAHALAGRQISGMGSGRAIPSTSPEGLPHGRPRAELGDVSRQLRRGPSTSVRAAGLRHVDGMALAGIRSCGEAAGRHHES